MLTPQQRKDMIERLRALPSTVASTVEGLDDAQLDTPYRDGSWSVRQVVHHLADSHMNAYIRMKLVLTEDKPTIKPYDQEEWAKLEDSRALSIEPSLAVLRGLHTRWAVMLESVQASDWSRTALHPERGEMSLDDFLELYAGHGEQHIEKVKALRNSRGW